MISQFGVSTNEAVGAEATLHQGVAIDHDMDPIDLFTNLGLLVLESRRPHPSTKGRTESPHCPLVNWKQIHVCSRVDPQCKEKDDVKSYIHFLYRNAIPLSIEVMLHPECCARDHRRVEIGAISEAGWHGDQQAVITEANTHLLEQWIVQLLPKRFPHGLSEPHLLLQAVRSFLCFSQISSWLSSTQGKSPNNVVYRVCAPGESFGANFGVEPEIHAFPIVNISKTSSIKVSVAHPPRLGSIPRVPCNLDHARVRNLRESRWMTRLAQRSSLDPKYGRGHHMKTVDSQSSSSDESGSEERRGAKSKRYPPSPKPRLPPEAYDEETEYLRGPKRDLSQFYSPDGFTRDLRDDITLDHIYLDTPTLSSPDRFKSRREEGKVWLPLYPEEQTVDGAASGDLPSDAGGQHKYPILDPRTFTPSPPLRPEKDPPSLSSPPDWEQSLRDLEHKYSSLNLDDIPRTECSSFESDQVSLDRQKEVLEMSQLDSSFQDESFDNGIVFSADQETFDDSDSLDLHPWDPDLTFNPLTLDHRIRTVSDSETCTLNVRLPDILRNVQSTPVSPRSNSRGSSTSDGHRAGGSGAREPVSLSRKSLDTLEPEPSIPEPRRGGGQSKPGLLKNILSKSSQHVSERGQNMPSKATAISTPKKNRKASDNSGAYIFNPCTGLPINSSPALLRKAQTTADCTSLLPSHRHMKSSPSCNNLEQTLSTLSQATRVLSTSAPAATSCLLGNFEESVLNGRLEPLGTLEGFKAEIGASGSFCPKHMTFPVTVYFFSVADEDAPSSYYGHINLEHLGKRGYRIPKTGTIQVILFNPNKTVVKMFVMRYDLSEMPPNSQTFARQRIFYMPSNADPDDESEKQLRYLLHLRFQSSSSGKIYLHTDIRMIFARHCPDLVSSLGTYELRSFTEFPTDPRFSPKK